MFANLNLSEAVSYSDHLFPPQNIDINQILSALLAATNAIARYDQMLKNMHNSEILLARYAIKKP